MLLLSASTAEGVPTNNPPHHKRQSHNQDSNPPPSFFGLIKSPFVMTADFFYTNRETINAFSTAVIAAFTILLFFATHGQLRHLRREFHASHRPKLVIRALDLSWIGDKTTISFDLINEGEAEAFQITAAFTIRQQISDLDVGSAGIPIVLEAGQLPSRIRIGRAVRCTGKCRVDMPSFFGGLQQIEAAGPEFKLRPKLIFDGSATYAGSTGVFRRSGYSRPYDASNLRFRSAERSRENIPVSAANAACANTAIT